MEAGERLTKLISDYSPTPEEVAKKEEAIARIAFRLEEGRSSIPFYQ